MAKKKVRGPRGGVKHTPGRGHDRKSGIAKTRRYMKKAQKKREEEEELLRKRWEEWDKLNDDQKRLRPELMPSQPRPDHGAQGSP
jgi:hypothetical protein